MNWYKKANLLEEIEKYGPDSQVTSIDDPRVQYISEKHNLPKEEAFRQLRNLGGDFYRRDYFAKEYGWSVPSQEAVDKVKEFVGSDNIIEIGAGHGAWAKIMQDAGIQITPTDSFSDRGAFVPKDNAYTDVQDLKAMDALAQYSGYNALMMSWPPYDEPLAADSLLAFTGGKLIFIGEGEGGCTGDDRFFEVLNANWKNVGGVNIPRWTGIWDRLYLWERK
jgi:hypothetical protein